MVLPFYIMMGLYTNWSAIIKIEFPCARKKDNVLIVLTQQGTRCSHGPGESRKQLRAHTTAVEPETKFVQVQLVILAAAGQGCGHNLGLFKPQGQNYVCIREEIGRAHV